MIYPHPIGDKPRSKAKRECLGSLGAYPRPLGSLGARGFIPPSEDNCAASCRHRARLDPNALPKIQQDLPRDLLRSELIAAFFNFRN